jgi:hypothetical protein
MDMNNGDREEVRRVIYQSYIQGVHGSQDLDAIDQGFHSDFAMLVIQNDTLEKVTMDQWLERIKTMKSESPDLWLAETRCSFELIDIAGNAATAKLEVFKGAVHFSTDYMLLYRFEEVWRIVSKIFSVPS